MKELSLWLFLNNWKATRSGWVKGEAHLYNRATYARGMRSSLKPFGYINGITPFQNTTEFDTADEVVEFLENDKQRT